MEIIIIMETESRKRNFHTGSVLLLSFSHFIHDIYTSFLAPLLPLIIEKHAITLGQAGFLSTIMQVPSLFNPVIGVWVDRKRLAKWLIILSPSMTAVPMCLIGMAPSYWVLLAMFFISGISVALYHVPSPTLISEMSGTKKGRGMSFYMTGGEAARTLGPIIAVAVASAWGLKGFYPLMTAAMMTSIMLYLKLDSIEVKSLPNRRISIISSARTLKHVLIPLSGMLLTTACMYSAMSVFLPVFIEHETGNLWLAGSGLALYEALGVAGILSAGIISDRLGRKKVLLTAFTVAPATLILFVFTDGALRVVMMLVTGFTLLSTAPVMLAIVQEHAGETPAAANGLYMMVSFAARAAAIVVVGIIGDMVGLKNMYILCALGAFTAIPFVLKLKDPGNE